MIYKDKYAKYDSNLTPWEREGLCLNCAKEWLEHHGWNCNEGEEYRFRCLDYNERFITQEMFDSIHGMTEKPKAIHSDNIPENRVDLSDWRVWAHKAEGDCPCGIKKQMCTYHKT